MPREISKGGKIMITLIATLKIKEGKTQEAINALKEIVPKIKASEPGAWSIYHTLYAAMKVQLFFMKNTVIRMP